MLLKIFDVVSRLFRGAFSPPFVIVAVEIAGDIRYNSEYETDEYF